MPAEPIKAPETPAPQPDKKPTEKQSASRKKAVQYEPAHPAGAVRGPGDAGTEGHAVWCKASAAGGRASPAGEARKSRRRASRQPRSCAKKPGRRKRAGCQRRRSLPCRLPAMVFAEDKASKPHAAPAMHFFGKGDDEEAPAAPARATPPSSDDSMSLPLM